MDPLLKEKVGGWQWNAVGVSGWPAYLGGRLCATLGTALARIQMRQPSWLSWGPQIARQPSACLSSYP